MNEQVISLQGVEKSYGKNKVLKGVNMQVNKGDIYGLIGKNGAGKTTLFKLMLGLCGYDSGNLSICGGASQAENNLNRRKIGFALSPGFYPYLSGEENLNYLARMKGKLDKKETKRIMEVIGLGTQAAKRKVAGYSMGMKKRLAIGGAIIGKPEILFLDEPANGLDPQGIVDIRNLIGSLNAELGMTVIVSSHILDELQHTAKRFGIINDGVMVAEMTQEDLVRYSSATTITVDDQYAQGAVEAIQARGIPVKSVEKKATSLEEFYFGLLGGDK